MTHLLLLFISVLVGLCCMYKGNITPASQPDWLFYYFWGALFLLIGVLGAMTILLGGNK